MQQVSGTAVPDLDFSDDEDDEADEEDVEVSSCKVHLDLKFFK